MVITKTFEITNKLGLHARAAAKIVAVTSRFPALVTLEKDGIQADGQSILGILSMACHKGTLLSVTVEGNNATDVMDALESLFNAKFDEE